jgi:hypothetical protein
MEKEFNVYGKIVINVEIDVNALTEEDAIKKAIENFKQSYNLHVIGLHHEPEEVEYKLNAVECDD